MELSNRPHILVTGAGGFIGKPLVGRLLQRGWCVRAMVRKPGTAPFPPETGLQLVCADIRDRSALVAALKDVSVVVHLAAAKSDEKWSDAVNVGGAQALVDACRAAGCARIINISTQSVKIHRKGTYARTKSQADQVFTNSGLKVTTLLPSVVYGEEMSGVFGTVLKLVQKLPVVPVLGDGKWISAPVYVGDVAEAVCLCIEIDRSIGKNYDIGGPNAITFDDFIDRMARQLGLRRRKMHVPLGVAMLAARILAMLLPTPPVTVSNVLGSNQDTHLDLGPAIEDLGFDPIDFNAGIQRVLLGANAAASQPTDAELAVECVALTRYLIGGNPAQELVDRYTAANRILMPEDPRGHGELRFVRRHPSTLPLIDAAAGILKPDSPVRRKALLMTAILEATPAYANYFLGAPDRPFPLACKVIWQGIRAIVKISLGIPLLWIARRS